MGRKEGHVSCRIARNMTEYMSFFYLLTGSVKCCIFIILKMHLLLVPELSGKVQPAASHLPDKHRIVLPVRKISDFYFGSRCQILHVRI